MTALVDWLAARRPEPPADLAQAMVGNEPATDGDGAPPMDAAVASGCDELRRALDHPGRVRESALSLLVADAWITYACEAALQEDDPIAALRTMTKRLGRLR